MLWNEYMKFGKDTHKSVDAVGDGLQQPFVYLSSVWHQLTASSQEMASALKIEDLSIHLFEAVAVVNG